MCGSPSEMRLAVIWLAAMSTVSSAALKCAQALPPTVTPRSFPACAIGARMRSRTPPRGRGGRRRKGGGQRDVGRDRVRSSLGLARLEPVAQPAVAAGCPLHVDDAGCGGVGGGVEPVARGGLGPPHGATVLKLMK
eukprot:COSAG01_NODE_166_length_23296_cov_140.506014_2_plen_136_part_00